MLSANNASLDILDIYRAVDLDHTHNFNENIRP
jgi:hypothetical protein